MPKFDVIVVGLGPTGATLAALLGQAGIQVAVFDRLADLYPMPRAIGLDHEAMRIIQELGLDERVKPHVAPYRPSEYLGLDGQLIKRLDALPEPHALGWAPNYVFDQPAFERVLRERLAEMDCVEVFLEADVEQTGQEEGVAWVDARLAGERSRTRFQADYVIACDGGASPIRRSLGIDLEDLGFDEPWLVVDALVSEEKLPQLPQTQVQYCEPTRPSTFVIGPGRHRRWEIMLLEGDDLSAKFSSEELWPLLARWVVPGDAELWRAAAYRFHGLVANEWRRGRILLAGDSAHMMPPFMAQGMVSGMRDAQNMAWKLGRVLRRLSSPTLLDTVMQERRPHVRQTILTAMELGRIICERDAERAAARDQRLRGQHAGTIKTEFRQNMIPNLEHGVIASANKMAGRLFPQPVVRARDFEGRLDDLTGGKVRVVTLGPLSSAEQAAYLDALAAFDGVLVLLGESGLATGPLLEVAENQPLIRSWLGKQLAVVVRPDHYVFGTAPDHESTLRLLDELRLALR